MINGSGRPIFPSDISDSLWEQVSALIPGPKSGGRPRKTDTREILNAILYMHQTGSTLRELPDVFPPWGTVHYYYRSWRMDGTWEKIERSLAQHGYRSSEPFHPQSIAAEAK
jgi:putative transposase